MDPGPIILLVMITVMIISYVMWSRRWFRIPLWLIGVYFLTRALIGTWIALHTALPPQGSGATVLDVVFGIPFLAMSWLMFWIMAAFELGLLIAAPAVFRRDSHARE